MYEDIFKKFIKKYNVTCDICGLKFSTNRSYQKFCSKKCRLENVEKKTKQKKEHKWVKTRFFILNRDNFKCQYCGKTIKDGIKLEVDHIIPKAKGGSNDLKNLITSCNICNVGKSDSLINLKRKSL